MISSGGKVGTAALVLSLLAPACSDNESRAEAACDFDPETVVDSADEIDPDSPIVLQTTLGPGPMGGEAEGTPLIVVYGSGSAVGVDRDGYRHARVTPEGIQSIRDCIDDSGFVELEDGYRNEEGRSQDGDRICAVADAGSDTVTGTARSGQVHTVSAYALRTTFEHWAEGECHLGYPESLYVVLGVGETIHEQVNAIGERTDFVPPPISD